MIVMLYFHEKNSLEIGSLEILASFISVLSFMRYELIKNYGRIDPCTKKDHSTGGSCSVFNPLLVKLEGLSF
jgi:hypothetical protein